MRYWLIMPAAGVGRRFGTSRPKQYAPLQGRTVIEWALTPFLADPACAGVVVALAAEDPYWGEVAQRLAAIPGRTPELIFAGGGAERGQTVRKGLAALHARAASDDWVLVHDAARPCLSSEDLQQLLSSLGSHRVGGLLATPAADTLKRAVGSSTTSAATGGAEVEQTVDRAGLWRALTPQMFRYGMLCDALDHALASGRLPTDEAQALEWMGERPVLVQGSAANIKITSADDLVLAAALLAARE
jgi:2-C-methyl-D-erythritol 4-phosphate cytidylyltransferase